MRWNALTTKASSRTQLATSFLLTIVSVNESKLFLKFDDVCVGFTCTFEKAGFFATWRDKHRTNVRIMFNGGEFTMAGITRRSAITTMVTATVAGALLPKA